MSGFIENNLPGSRILDVISCYVLCFQMTEYCVPTRLARRFCGKRLLLTGCILLGILLYYNPPRLLASTHPKVASTEPKVASTQTEASPRPKLRTLLRFVKWKHLCISTGFFQWGSSTWKSPYDICKIWALMQQSIKQSSLPSQKLYFIGKLFSNCIWWLPLFIDTP